MVVNPKRFARILVESAGLHLWVRCVSDSNKFRARKSSHFTRRFRCGKAENFDVRRAPPKVSRLKSHIFSAAAAVVLVAMAGIGLGGGVNSLIATPGLQKVAVPSPSATVTAAGCSRFKKFGLHKVSHSRRRPFRISAADVPDFLPATWYDKSIFHSNCSSLSF